MAPMAARLDDLYTISDRSAHFCKKSIDELAKYLMLISADAVSVKDLDQNAKSERSIVQVAMVAEALGDLLYLAVAWEQFLGLRKDAAPPAAPDKKPESSLGSSIHEPDDSTFLDSQESDHEEQSQDGYHDHKRSFELLSSLAIQ